MSLKLITIFVLNFLLMSSVVSQEIMGKYSSKYSSDGDVFWMYQTLLLEKKYIFQLQQMVFVPIQI